MVVKLSRQLVAVVIGALFLIAPPAQADVIGDLVDQVSLERIQAHLAALEGPRNTGPLKRAAASYIEEQLRSFGYEVELAPSLYSDNVTAELHGKRTPHKVFIVGAHYDSVRNSPGADDNASGVAGLLEIAQVLSGLETGASIRFVAFADEEDGLIGSRRYAAQARAASEDIIGLFSLEMIGYTCSTPGCQFVFPDMPGCLEVEVPNPTEGEFIAVVANEYSQPLLDEFLAAAGRYVPALPVGWGVGSGLGCVADTRRSDHSPFWDEGYRGLMITDTANFRNPNYHQPTDTVSTLNLPFLKQVTQASLATTVRVVALAEDLARTPSRTPRPTSTPTPEPTPLPSSARLQAFLASPDLSVLDIESGVITGKFGACARSMALTRDAAQLYFACLGRVIGSSAGIGALNVLDVATNTIDTVVPLSEDARSIVLSPDENLAYVADHGGQSGAGRLNVIDLNARDVLAAIPVGRALSGLSVTPDGRKAYLSDHEDEVIYVVDIPEQRVIATIPLIPRYAGNTPWTTLLSRDAGTLYVAELGAGTFVVIDTATDAIIDTFPVFRRPSIDLALTGNGERIYAASCCYGKEYNVFAVDTRTNTIANVLPLPDNTQIEGLGLAPDEGSAYVGVGPLLGSLWQIDLATGAVARTIPLEDGAPERVLVAWVPNPGPPTSPTPMNTPTQAPTRTPCKLACAGDCGLDGSVTVDEVVYVTNVALGTAPMRDCDAADVNADCDVTVEELVAAVSNALGGCGSINRARGCVGCF